LIVPKNNFIINFNGSRLHDRSGVRNKKMTLNLISFRFMRNTVRIAEGRSAIGKLTLHLPIPYYAQLWGHCSPLDRFNHFKAPPAKEILSGFPTTT
jgi:hypothetical protein